MIEIDGAAGEGGGQIIRTALSLSLLTGEAFTIEDVRGRRTRPGLLRQHLTAVKAAARVGAARVEGDHLGSDRLVFEPQALLSGTYDLAIGSAGSATLVAQTLLPALIVAEGASTLSVSGGTHNPAAPTYDYLDRTFLPLLARMGVEIGRTLHAPGFFPAGGGRLTLEIPARCALRPITLDTLRAPATLSARVLTAHLPDHVALREADQLAEGLGLPRAHVEIEQLDEASIGPGNAVVISARREDVFEQFTAFGRKGAKAEQVASEAVAEARAWLAAGAPVGSHLADQLILPLALAGGGGFLTAAPTQHTLTQVETVGRFLDVPIRLGPLEGDEAPEIGPRLWRLEVGRREASGE